MLSTRIVYYYYYTLQTIYNVYTVYTRYTKLYVLYVGKAIMYSRRCRFVCTYMLRKRLTSFRQIRLISFPYPKTGTYSKTHVVNKRHMYGSLIVV